MGQTVAEIWPFSIFQDGGRSPSCIFKKFKILTAHTPRRAKMHHCAKFCANRSRHCEDMTVFDFSRWRLSAILDFQKLEILTAHTLWRAKMRHHAEFCADRSNPCGYMAVYNFSRWRPSAMLDFKKFKILTAVTLRRAILEFQKLEILTAHTLWRAKMRHNAEFCADRLNRSGDMAVYNFFKMAAVRHLGF